MCFVVFVLTKPERHISTCRSFRDAVILMKLLNETDYLECVEKACVQNSRRKWDFKK